MSYFNYQRDEKGYTMFYPTRASVAERKGKQAIVLLRKDYDANRGIIRPRHIVLHSMCYSTIYIDGGNDHINRRDVLEIASKDDVTITIPQEEYDTLVAKAAKLDELDKKLGDLYQQDDTDLITIGEIAAGTLGYL